MTGQRRPPISRTRPISGAWGAEAGSISNLKGARILALLGDMVTTDHISPAGSFKASTPAGGYPGKTTSRFRCCAEFKALRLAAAVNHER